MSFVIIKDSYRLERHALDGNTIGYRGIVIYPKGNAYYISLENKLLFSDGNKIKKLEYRKYEIYCESIFYGLEVYVYEKEDGLDEYRLYRNEDFLLSFNPRSNVRTDDPYLKEHYLLYKDHRLQSSFQISVNHCQYNGTALKDGDLVECLGLRFFHFADYLYMNSFMVKITISPYDDTPRKIRYITSCTKPSYYLPEMDRQLAIEEIKPFKQEKKPDFLPFFRSLFPNIIMSFSMTAMALLNYMNSYDEEDEWFVSLAFFLMPISMAITGIVFPLAMHLYECRSCRIGYERSKKEYLDYLDEYERRLDLNIKEYIDSKNSHFFSLIGCKERMFYATKNSTDYLSISIGRISIERDIEYEPSGNEEIDGRLMEIGRKLKDIKGYPLFVSLEDKKIITIVSRRNMKRYFFNRFLFELSYKHHYDDIHIAIFSKDQDIYDLAYDLPHLFIDGERMSLQSESDLLCLDQRRYDRPLVLLMYSHTSFAFSNPLIHIIYFSSDIADLYKNSDAVIECFDNYGYLYSSIKQRFEYIEEEIDFREYFSYLGRMRSIASLDRTYAFMDVYKDFDIKGSYSHEERSLKANFAFANGEILDFDLHETKQGPHGLIGGYTGSGKSELIISMLLSMCLRYSPEYLNIVLIDYKGGGIRESLSYGGKAIPHIVASISNLEDNVFERMIIAIANECTRRQLIFKQMSGRYNLPIMNLDDYASNCPNEEKLSHLIIMVDEFAELKKEEPELIKELISLSRIGRSLGIHLILATQKPSGSVDDEIWSNSRFKIALKVLEENDSKQLIKSEDAAYLERPGLFYLLVDGSLQKGQSIYSKNDINGNDPFKVSVLKNTLHESSSITRENGIITSEASYFSQKIIEVCEKEDYKIRKLDFMPPSRKARKDFEIKDRFVLGEKDDYILGKREILSYGLSESILVCSSRYHEINAFMNILSENRRQTIVIGQTRYHAPCVSDSLLYEEDEDIMYLLDMLLKGEGKDICLLIEDLACLLSYNEIYLELLYRLCRRRESLSLSLIFISRNSQLNFKLINSFNNRLLIDSSDANDLINLFGSRSRHKGTSFFLAEEPICFVPIREEELKEGEPLFEEMIRHIPETIRAKSDEDGYLLGYDKKFKQEVTYKGKLLVTSYDSDRIEIYRKAYGDAFTIMAYDHALGSGEYGAVLWLGPGIYRQRLFIPSCKDDLDEDEALLVKGSRHILLRGLDDA